MNWLFCAKNVNKLVVLEKSGKSPEKSLLDITIRFTFGKFVMESGRLPEKRFPVR